MLAKIYNLVLEEVIDSKRRSTDESKEAKVTDRAACTLFRTATRVSTGIKDTSQKVNNTCTSRDLWVLEATDQQEGGVDRKHLECVLMSTLNTVEYVLERVLFGFSLFSIN